MKVKSVIDHDLTDHYLSFKSRQKAGGHNAVPQILQNPIIKRYMKFTFFLKKSLNMILAIYVSSL